MKRSDAFSVRPPKAIRRSHLRAPRRSRSSSLPAKQWLAPFPRPGAGVKRGYVHGKSDATGSAPLENPVHPTELLATIYHSVGIQPTTLVYNHLKQPRELVKAEAVSGILS